MSFRCPKCNTSGGNMRRCKACGRVYCYDCDGDKRAGNRCPFCGTIGKLETNPS